MNFLTRLKNRIAGRDPFYDEVEEEKIGLYQYYFVRVIDAVDLDTQTKWSQGKDYDRSQMEKDERAMEQIIAVEARREDLAPVVLQVMVNQYFFADIYQREIDKRHWVKRVLHRKDVDYFPTGWRVRAGLEKLS